MLHCSNALCPSVWASGAFRAWGSQHKRLCSQPNRVAVVVVIIGVERQQLWVENSRRKQSTVSGNIVAVCTRRVQKCKVIDKSRRASDGDTDRLTLTLTLTQTFRHRSTDTPAPTKKDRQKAMDKRWLVMETNQIEIKVKEINLNCVCRNRQYEEFNFELETEKEWEWGRERG